VEAQTDGAGDTDWFGAGNFTGDHVFTETDISYDDKNYNPTVVTTKDRFHDATGTGQLGSPTAGTLARDSYVSYYYDLANRLTASTDVGTFGGANAPAPYSRPSTVTPSGANTHTTTYTYNDAGWVSQVTDPRGLFNQTSYDMLGQVTQTVNAYTGNPTTSSDQTTNYTYDANGNVVNVQALMPGSSPNQQNTAYVYGVSTTNGSGVNSNDLLAKVEYPDPTTGAASSSSTNQETYQYNAVGDPISFTDPNGSTHTYAYDLLGRQVSDAVTLAVGSSVDGTVRKLTTAYDGGGRPYLFTSLDGASNVLNQVENLYNNLGQLTDQYQAHTGAVNLSTTPEVQYVYTDLASGNNSRLTQMVYPSGRKLDYVYSSGAGVYDDAISRVSSLNDDNSGIPGTVLEGDSYLGLGTIIRRAHPEIGIYLSYIQQTGDTHANTDAGDKYTGLDRFGRVIDQNWLITSNPLQSTDRFQYTYDRMDDVLAKNNIVNTAFGELYRPNAVTAGDSNSAYDPLQRMTNFARGTLTKSNLNGSQLDTISSPSTTQSWSLDALGNWSGQTVGGSTTTRSFNAQNQTTSTSPGTAPTYDHNGNTITDNGQTFIYDAWNRLVTVKTTSTGVTVASYLYDAQGWRIRETYGSNTNDLYYDSSWQLIEARANGAGVANLASQYVWSPAGIDTMVLRDSFSGGVQTGRLYVQQDANDNVTAIVDASTKAVVERYIYDPYGNSTILTATWGTRGSSSYGWIYRFQGGRLDTNITGGWYGFRNRDYIPAEGRWAERDPLGFEGGDANVYRFVGNNPPSDSDPSGLKDSYGPNESASPFGSAVSAFLWYYPSFIFGESLTNVGTRFNEEYGKHTTDSAAVATGGNADEQLDKLGMPGMVAGSGHTDRGGASYYGQELSESGQNAAMTFSAATGGYGPRMVPGNRGRFIAPSSQPPGGGRGPGGASSVPNSVTSFMKGRRGGEVVSDQALKNVEWSMLSNRVVLSRNADAMLARSQAGGVFRVYKDGSATMFLASNPTRYELLHELQHYEHFMQIGPQKYLQLGKTAAGQLQLEQFAYDNLRRYHWGSLTSCEIQHAQDYIRRLGGNAW
jgi:RHS repeat-associated protein